MNVNMMINSRVPKLEPIGYPMQHIPEQTEPEDLSMSTGMHSHSSGESPMSRSPASRDDPDEPSEEFDIDVDVASEPPSTQQRQRHHVLVQ